MSIHLSIKNLSLRYDNLVLFHDLSLDLTPGKHIALLGTSGVGKSTLLRFIAKLPTGCQLAAGGITPDYANQISYMSQQTALMPWANVMNNILIGKKLRKETITKEDKERVELLLHNAHLDSIKDHHPNQLSGGMQQRVALLHTLFEDKAIVLLDEPFSALDAITRIKLQDFAIELLKEKIVLTVTHDPLEALRIADEVYVLNGKPTTLSKPIKPKGQAPRAVDDVDLLKQQAELLKLLAT